jgi:hypothetical protein
MANDTFSCCNVGQYMSHRASHPHSTDDDWRRGLSTSSVVSQCRKHPAILEMVGLPRSRFLLTPLILPSTTTYAFGNRHVCLPRALANPAKFCVLPRCPRVGGAKHCGTNCRSQPVSASAECGSLTSTPGVVPTRVASGALPYRRDQPGRRACPAPDCRGCPDAYSPHRWESVDSFPLYRAGFPSREMAPVTLRQAQSPPRCRHRVRHAYAPPGDFPVGPELQRRLNQRRPKTIEIAPMSRIGIPFPFLRCG